MLKKVAQVFGVGLGVVALVFGEADDSPGLQGIGVILVMAVFFSLYKIVRRN
jgi:drug/metabolite transporter (DMT)-like permease